MSGQFNQQDVGLDAVNGKATDRSSIEHGEALIAFTEAVMANDAEAMVRERTHLRTLLTDAELVDAAAIIGAFNVVTRIADATGIPLDPILRDLSTEVREELDLARFGSAANTP